MKPVLLAVVVWVTGRYYRLGELSGAKTMTAGMACCGHFVWSQSDAGTRTMGAKASTCALSQRP
jgi:hypothetical protein